MRRTQPERRPYADSPLLRLRGPGVRVSDPSPPLLRPKARLDSRTERLLQAQALRAVPHPWWPAAGGHHGLRPLLAAAMARIGAATGSLARACLARRRLRQGPLCPVKRSGGH